jgi:hypothetical protein
LGLTIVLFVSTVIAVFIKLWRTYKIEKQDTEEASIKLGVSIENLENKDIRYS